MEELQEEETLTGEVHNICYLL